MSDAPAPDFGRDADHTAESVAPDTDDGAESVVHGVPEPVAPGPDTAVIDLDAVERDLTAVETALARLSDGTYYTDEVTGQPLPADLLVADPTARRA